MFKKEVLTALLKVASTTIAFEDLGRYLPFQTRIVGGENLNHIQSQTAYDARKSLTHPTHWTRGGFEKFSPKEFS